MCGAIQHFSPCATNRYRIVNSPCQLPNWYFMLKHHEAPRGYQSVSWGLWQKHSNQQNCWKKQKSFTVVDFNYIMHGSWITSSFSGRRLPAHWGRMSDENVYLPKSNSWEALCWVNNSLAAGKTMEAMPATFAAPVKIARLFTTIPVPYKTKPSPCPSFTPLINLSVTSICLWTSSWFGLALCSLRCRVTCAQASDTVAGNSRHDKPIGMWQKSIAKRWGILSP